MDEAEWPVRRNHAAAVVGRDILVLGGDGGTGLLNDVFSLTRCVPVGACDPCEEGTYTETFECVPCAAGTASSAVGALSAATCEDCPRGSFSLSGATACEACGPGTFSGTARTATCEACPAGTFREAAGATAREDCEACPLGAANSRARGEQSVKRREEARNTLTSL